MEENTNKVVERFKRAVKDVYEKGELDKIIKLNHKSIAYAGYTKKYVREERRRAKEVKKFLDYASKTDKGIEGVPFLILIMALNSSEVFKDVLLFMVNEEKKERVK